MNGAESGLARAVEIFALLNVLLTGLSHIVRPRAWARFFIQLRERGEPGVFLVAFLSLGFGSVIVALHDVWRGIPAVLTVYGWSQVIKAAVYLTAPSVGLRVLARIREDRPGEFVWAGAFHLVIGALLLVHLIRT